jgi:hypothetical protein
MSEQMQPSILDFNVGEYRKFDTMPDDSEVQVLIKKAEIKKSAKGNTMIHLTLEVVNEASVDDIHYYCNWPDKARREEDPKNFAKMVNRIIEMREAFSIPSGEMEVSRDLPGNIAWAILGIDETDKGQRNTIKRFTHAAD